MRINTNVASMTALESNTQINKNLSDSLGRLSSGLRINKASDDASGMAIADKLRTQASSVSQGIANANSANTFVQIADKAMAEQSNILDIVKSKLMQASTSTTSDEGRIAILNDIQVLLTQFNAISSNTNYNGQTLLDGTDFEFQIGELVTDKVSVNTSYAATTTAMGSAAENLGGALVHTTGANATTAQVDTASLSDNGGTWKAGDTAIIEISNSSNSEVYSYAYTVTQADVDADGTTAVEDAVGTALIALVNADTSKHDITAGGTTPDITLTSGTVDVRFENKLSIGKSLDGLSSMSDNNFTATVATEYLTVIDGALDKLNTVRSEFGSAQNQVESAIRNMMTTKTNLKAAESIIRDVDYAEESANFNKQNIIAQAGTYAISQANNVQQNVLKLLQ